MGVSGELAPKKKKFLLALLTSENVAEASKKAGVAESTGYRYMREDDFKKHQRQVMRQIMQTTTGRLQYEAIKSVNVLAELRDDETTPPYARVEASKILLEMAYKSLELDDIQERLEHLEALLNEE